MDKIKIIDCQTINNYYKKHKNLDFGNIINKRISQGLIAIKKIKLLGLEWIDKTRGEDKDFNLKSLNKKNKIVVIDCYLSSYNKYHPKMMKKYNKQAWLELKDMLL